MEIKNLNDALLAFQKKGIKIGKDATNPHFKNKYATLSKILERVNPVLNEIGLTVTHRVVNSELVTAVHFGEQKIESAFPIQAVKPQEFGSYITFGKRYNLGALLNLDIDDDDDGNAANEAKPKFDKKALEGLKSVIGKFKTSSEAIDAAKKKYEVSFDDEMDIVALF